ncbi:D-lactate dehydrogenase [Verticillium dahliae]|nr:D-lactate dehydrogenase [Verticillium dahliae]
MARLPAHASQSALRRFRTTPRSTAYALRHLASDSKPPERVSNEDKAGRSFQGQVTGSITQRLARERADRERFANEREKSASSRSYALTFVLLFTMGSSYYLGTLYPPKPSEDSTLPLDKTIAPEHKTNMENMQAAWADFVHILGKEHVSTAPNDLDHHASSEWSSHPAKASERPFCVVFPSSTEDVAAIMKVCHRRRIPVVGYSGGTSLEGHFVPTRGGVCVDFGRMNKVLALHEADLDVVVQPAVGWEALNDQLGASGLFFPPDPGPGAMIGGMVGTGCSGTNAYRYGTMREWVLSLTVVLADGTVIKTRQRPRKSSAGYDLTKLFIGSEGTLGLVTEATLKVTVKPASTSVAVATFPSIRHAANCVARVVGAGVPVAAVEILDDLQMRCINDSGTTGRAWQEAPTLFFKFAGTARGVKEQVALVQGFAGQAGGRSFEFARSEEEQHDLWSARKEALWSTMAAKRDGDHVWTGDVAVPMSRLPDIIEETKDAMGKSGLFGTIVGHVGDGNFHIILLYNDKERKRAETLVHNMVKRAVEMEGTVTGEHGVGLVKRDYLPHELGETTVDAMRQKTELNDLNRQDDAEDLTRHDRGNGNAQWQARSLAWYNGEGCGAAGGRSRKELASSPRASHAGSQRFARPASIRSKSSEKKRQEKESQNHQQPQQGESSASNHDHYATPSGPPPGHGEYAPPAGPPPPPQTSSSNGYAPPSGPPPAQYAAPSSPPPHHDHNEHGPPPSHNVNGGYAAPPGPPQGQDYDAPAGPPPGFSAPPGPPPGHETHDAPERPVRLLPDGSYAPPESRTHETYAPPAGPPPGHGQFALPVEGPPAGGPPAAGGDFAPPPGPPPGGDIYGPPAGAPPGGDSYGPPAGPPPGGDYAPPPGPPPTDSKSQHDWQHAVPDTSLFPPPPSFFTGFERSPANNASEQEAHAGAAWCDQYPLIQPVPLPPQAHEALRTHNINLMQPQNFRGTLAPSATVPGTWEGRTDVSAKDSCIIGYPPLYSAHAHSPLVTGRPVRIYYEVHIRPDSRPDEVDLALGFTALPYPNFRMPGWHRGSLAVHGDDGHKYVNDWAGGHSFTEPFRVGETVGIGMSLSPRGDGSINVDIFFTREGKIVGSWNLHEEGDAEEDLPVTGLEGYHDLSCAIGTFNHNSFEIIFEPSRWKYQDARESTIAGEGKGWAQ